MYEIDTAPFSNNLDGLKHKSGIFDLLKANDALLFEIIQTTLFPKPVQDGTSVYVLYSDDGTGNGAAVFFEDSQHKPFQLLNSGAIPANPKVYLVDIPVLGTDSDPVNMSSGATKYIHRNKFLAVYDSTALPVLPADGHRTDVCAWGDVIYLNKRHFIGDAGEPAFQNAWANDIYNATFKRGVGGLVQINGRVANAGSLDSVIFTLPVGFRPPALRTFLTYIILAGQPTAVTITVDSATGNVTCYSNGLANHVIYLDGVSFYID